MTIFNWPWGGIGGSDGGRPAGVTQSGHSVTSFQLSSTSYWPLATGYW